MCDQAKFLIDCAAKTVSDLRPGSPVPASLQRQVRTAISIEQYNGGLEKLKVYAATKGIEIR